jgi:hypothetical protein
VLTQHRIRFIGRSGWAGIRTRLEVKARFVLSASLVSQLRRGALPASAAHLLVVTSSNDIAKGASSMYGSNLREHDESEVIG